MSAALPAFGAEAVFYLCCGFDVTRDWFRNFVGRRMEPALLWASAVLPYLIFSLAAGTFVPRAFYLLCVLCAVVAFWHTFLPRRILYDVGFLVVATAPIISGVFRRIYVSPDPHLRVDILGHLMWIRLAISAFLVFREWNPGAFSFWPDAREWKIGFVWYLAAIVPLVTVAVGIHDVRFAPLQGEWWKIAAIGVGTFFAFLWVIALGEELFFRGVVERAFLDANLSPALAVAISAAVFGGAHLWFHAFPNWHRALVASVLGLACGLAYLQTRTVRTPMVTHAFVVMTWRVLFRDY